jgi:hypothetical protein
MSVGVLKSGQTISATQPLEWVNSFAGSATGKDGTGGASFASANITSKVPANLPWQVKIPSRKKKSLEARPGQRPRRNWNAGHGALALSVQPRKLCWRVVLE